MRIADLSAGRRRRSAARWTWSAATSRRCAPGRRWPAPMVVRRSTAPPTGSRTTIRGRSASPMPSAGWSWDPATPRRRIELRRSRRLVGHPLDRLGGVLGRIDGVLHLAVRIAPCDAWAVRSAAARTLIGRPVAWSPGRRVHPVAGSPLVPRCLGMRPDAPGTAVDDPCDAASVRSTAVGRSRAHERPGSCVGARVPCVGAARGGPCRSGIPWI